VRIADPNKDGVGEIQVRGPIVMRGYFRNEAATKEVFEGDWFCTGDLGRMDSEGYVTITGRKKSMIVNREGKNIYPEEIEAHFNDSRNIAEILIVGRKEKEFGGEQIFAVVVPNYENLALDHPGKEKDDAFVSVLIKKEIEQINRALVGYKKITDFTVRKEPFEKNAQQKIRRFLYKSYENPK
jgi:long-chain acyl-CoA synthetase